MDLGVFFIINSNYDYQVQHQFERHYVYVHEHVVKSGRINAWLIRLQLLKMPSGAQKRKKKAAATAAAAANVELPEVDFDNATAAVAGATRPNEPNVDDAKSKLVPDARRGGLLTLASLAVEDSVLLRARPALFVVPEAHATRACAHTLRLCEATSWSTSTSTANS